MKILLFILSLVVFSSGSFSQGQLRYFELTMEARKCAERKEFKRAGQNYSRAFRANGGKATVGDRYDAARSWSMAGMKDSAFSQLMKIASLHEYDNYNQLIRDSCFAPLLQDPRWPALTALIQQNIGKAEVKLNKRLVYLLDSIYREDQTCRLSAVSIRNQYGPSSPQSLEMHRVMQRKDSANLVVVRDIIEKYGWLGKDVVGSVGSSAMFMVMRHAAVDVQERYLPQMQEAFKKNTVDPYEMALLIDRLQLRKGKKQVYGMVVISQDGGRHYIAPVEDPEHLDRTRTSIGLNVMDEYLANWKMSWDLKAYKKDLITLEKESIPYADLFFEK